MNIKFWMKNPHLVVPRIRFWLFEKFNSDKPWLCVGTINALDRNLKPHMTGVEFGSGRSTRWLAGKLKSLLSVEHCEEWHHVVVKQLADANVRNVDYRYIPLDHAESEPELDFYPTTPKYVAVLDEFDDGTVDFVLVDGHYRTTCIHHALRTIRPGGLLVVDDTQMWSATGGPPVPDDWECVDTSTNGIKTASIWRRPSE